MAEIYRKVVPYEFNYLCDSCNNGMMKASGDKDAEGHYPHKCMICSAEASLSKSYPHVEFFGEGEEPTH